MRLSSPEPISDVHHVDHQTRGPDDRAGHRRGVVGVGVLVDLEALLHLQIDVGRVPPVGPSVGATGTAVAMSSGVLGVIQAPGSLVGVGEHRGAPGPRDTYERT